MTAGAYPGVRSISIADSPQHFARFPWQFAGTHLYSWVERGTGRVKCLSQGHNTMTRPGLEPELLDPESSVSHNTKRKTDKL